MRGKEKFSHNDIAARFVGYNVPLQRSGQHRSTVGLHPALGSIVGEIAKGGLSRSYEAVCFAVCASSLLPLQCTYRLVTGEIFEEVHYFSSDSRQRAPPTRVSTAGCAHRCALDPLPSDTPGEAGDHSVPGILSADPEHGGWQLPRLGCHFVAIGHGRRAEDSAS
ncbi:hypothetical protein NDU88_010219 [Pleurodeles waltl]|uniref:Uncharacterized protein n=1 Tax=Pleurodeles waltl TaxID=8319 RepID=A0AAV7S020_PLEWA|nr:hypothetical protein NDU88_010219 [Pleurodeles waltl]